jgi:meckelin
MQTERLVHVPATLIVLAFLLRGLGVEYLATAQPDGTDLSPAAAPINKLLRFFVSMLLWWSLVGLQLLFRHLIYHRFVEDKAAQFVDLLAVLNVSCCVLDHRLHMFYIHGKSVHSHADATLEDIHR